MSGGALPNVCGSCRAFLVAGRPDCPFCGAVAGMGAPAVAPPTPGPPVGGPPPEAMRRRAGPPTGARKVLFQVLAVLTTVASIGARYLSNQHRLDRLTGDDRTEQVSSDDLSPDLDFERADPQGQAEAICRGELDELGPAPRYRPGPGVHPFQILGLVGGSSFVDDALAIDDRADEFARAQLVACYTEGARHQVGTCPVNGGSYRLLTADGQVVVRTMATGEVLLRKDLPAAATAPCELTHLPDTDHVVRPFTELKALVLTEVLAEP